MKRFLSWIVFALCFGLGCFLVRLIVKLGLYIFSTYHSVFSYLLFGAPSLVISLVLIYYVPSLCILASESVCRSREGLRYRVYSILCIVLSVLSIILAIISPVAMSTSDYIFSFVSMIFSVLILHHVKQMFFDGVEDIPFEAEEPPAVEKSDYVPRH